MSEPQTVEELIEWLRAIHRRAVDDPIWNPETAISNFAAKLKQTIRRDLAVRAASQEGK